MTKEIDTTNAAIKVRSKLQANAPSEDLDKELNSIIVNDDIESFTSCLDFAREIDESCNTVNDLIVLKAQLGQIDNALHIAAAFKATKIATKIAKEESFLARRKNKKGLFPLDLAIRSANIDILKALTQSNPGFNYTEAASILKSFKSDDVEGEELRKVTGKTAEELAEFSKEANKLLNWNIAEQNKAGVDQLLKAIAENNPEHFNVDNCPDIYIDLEHKTSVLHWAAAANCPWAVKTLLDLFPARSLWRTDIDGWDPIHYAITFNADKALEAIFEFFPKAAEHSSAYVDHAISSAAIKCLRILTNEGADINKQYASMVKPHLANGAHNQAPPQPPEAMNGLLFRIATEEDAQATAAYLDVKV